MTDTKIKVDRFEWRRLHHAIEQMQGRTFYCEDEDGVLRRWYPPRLIKKNRTL